jgi:hypothetical protein
MYVCMSSNLGQSSGILAFLLQVVEFESLPDTDCPHRFIVVFLRQLLRIVY